MAVLSMDAPGETTQYSVRITNDEAEIRSARRLRHLVLAEEFGVIPDSNVMGCHGDEFDDYCDHLVVMARGTHDMIATCRLLPPDRLAITGHIPCASHFNLATLAPLRASFVEVGRAYIHPRHRDGGVTAAMTASLVRYAHRYRCRWFGGATSISVADGGRNLATAWRKASPRHLSPPPLRVAPRFPWPVEFVDEPAVTEGLAPPAGPHQLPPWLRGYIRLGGWVCGPPAYDQSLHAASLFSLVSIDRIDPRHVDRCLTHRA